LARGDGFRLRCMPLESPLPSSENVSGPEARPFSSISPEPVRENRIAVPSAGPLKPSPNEAICPMTCGPRVAVDVALVGSVKAPVSEAKSTTAADDPSVDVERAGVNATGSCCPGLSSVSVVQVCAPGLPCACPRSVG
jgi:hypothetical protein